MNGGKTERRDNSLGSELRSLMGHRSKDTWKIRIMGVKRWEGVLISVCNISVGAQEASISAILLKIETFNSWKKT
jgi:hypothetical protein